MDLVLTAASRALDAGDVLEALKRVALRKDAPALGLRGVALARLGQFDRARELLRAAARAFGDEAPLGRARCLLADAEIALATRDLRGVDAALGDARATLAAHGDGVNAAHAVCLAARCLVLRGRLREAARALGSLQLGRAPARLVAEVELTWAALHLRTPAIRAARAALARADRAAKAALIPAFLRESAALRARLAAPAARLSAGGAAKSLRLAEVEALLRRPELLLVDARELCARTPTARVDLARRPVLFALLRALAEAWPGAATRAALVSRVFAASRPNDSHRARLRVEMARLRRALRGLAALRATAQGFQLTPVAASRVLVLAASVEDEHPAVVALLADGEAWSSSALAIALGASQRSVQRALLELEGKTRVRAVGRARARRWLLAASAELAPPLSLPSPLGNG